MSKNCRHYLVLALIWLPSLLVLFYLALFRVETLLEKMLVAPLLLMNCMIFMARIILFVMRSQGEQAMRNIEGRTE